MTYKGINYDTGTPTTTGGLTRPDFEQQRVLTELTIIKNELHCNAIRISGNNLVRSVSASK
jgi:hypothetical protein